MAGSNPKINNLREWLGHALAWLHGDDSSCEIQPPQMQLLEMMAEAIQAGDLDQAWALMDEMNELRSHLANPFELGEICVWCAKTAVDLGKLKDALSLLQEAEKYYENSPHQHAVALWMTGCIHWHSLHRVEGITAWQEALSLFKTRQHSREVTLSTMQWYAETLPKLTETLKKANQSRELPPFGGDREEQESEGPGEQPQQASSSAGEPAEEQNIPRSNQESSENDFISWLSCLVSESVPAGGFGPVGYDPDPVGFLEITEIQIENIKYHIHSVRRASLRSNAVNISPRHLYMTIHVHGTSMNKSKPVPIEDGDYILVRSQSSAEDNDIVVAGISGQDERATVKRYRCSNGKVRLLPESMDPEHKELDWEKEFDEFGGEFMIVGVVEAVFKKKE